jgi:hypothetical protein
VTYVNRSVISNHYFQRSHDEITHEIRRRKDFVPFAVINSVRQTSSYEILRTESRRPFLDDMLVDTHLDYWLLDLKTTKHISNRDVFASQKVLSKVIVHTQSIQPSGFNPHDLDYEELTLGDIITCLQYVTTIQQYFRRDRV